MAFKQILVPLLGYGGDRAALRIAHQLAKLSDAHILALHIKADALAETPLMVDVGVALGELVEAAERHIEKRAQSARAAFETFRAEHVQGNILYREERGQSSQLLPAFGRMSDILVMGRPLANDAMAASIMDVEHALFGSGHPVMLVPENIREDYPLLDMALISWNNSVEATHAVGASLPLLSHVKRVGVVALPDGDEGHSVTHMLEYLARHNLSAHLMPISKDEGSIPVRILRLADKEKAGFIIMGAYTHSRLRQLILGGVTSHMVEKADIPILMMH